MQMSSEMECEAKKVEKILNIYILTPKLFWLLLSRCAHGNKNQNQIVSVENKRQNYI